MNWDQWPEIALQLMAAMVAGGSIGVQRAFRGKVAGVRTHILICVGSALFTQISRFLPMASSGPDAASDATRIASQVVVGCGFIGAGTIIRSGWSVAGITSAATIWVCAALGCAAGAGLYPVLVGGTVISLVTLIVLGSLRIESLRSYLTFHITFRNPETLERYKKRLAEEKITFRLVGFHRLDDDMISVDLLLRVAGPRLQSLEAALLQDKDVLRVSGNPQV